MKTVHQPVFPFTAITGQDDMKLALIINAVNPRAGGVLLRGEKGTAKSSAVRALGALLDKPFVELPLNISEDRFLGGIDIQAAVKHGRNSVKKGIAADAHRGFLYVDEVNLLDDHIVDLLLHTASNGFVQLQREGVSAEYPAEFVLCGSMNPEEGELRPQFLDRFGLAVQISSSGSVADRVMLMENRELFDNKPESFIKAHEDKENSLKKRIADAGELLPFVSVSQGIKTHIAETVLAANAAGHRADIIIAEAAKAIAAFDKRTEVTKEDADKAAEFALLHRRNEMQGSSPEGGENSDSGEDKDKKEQSEHNEQKSKGSKNENSSEADASPEQKQNEGSETETVFAAGEPFRVRRIEAPKDRKIRRGSGRRTRSRTSLKHGRYVRSSGNRRSDDIAIDATLRAAAPFQRFRTAPDGMAWALKPEDIREKVREKRTGSFILFVVDSSGSMGAKSRMSAAKGAVLSLLLDAYQKRDKVAMITFRDKKAETALSPTSSVELAERKLRELPTGGRTPLTSALNEGKKLTDRYLRHNPDAKPIVILLTDGRANLSFEEGQNPRKEAAQAAELWAKDQRIHFIVIDAEKKGLVDFALAGALAEQLSADFFEINELRADTLLNAVKRSINE